ncbi:MAG: hypothetical protein ACI865_002857 [Flavobacteriaceae bacterium]
MLRKRSIDIMTEMTKATKKEKGFSFEGGEPCGTSDSDVALYRGWH